MDRKDGWYVSQYNLMEEVLGAKKIQKTLKTYDTTLRDGEQSIGVSFTKHQKLQIAKLLSRLGVNRLEAGMPIVSKEDKDAVALILGANLPLEVWGFCRSAIRDIEACIDVGVKSVVCEIPASDYKLKAYGMDRETVKKKALTSLAFAKEHDLYTAFFVVDATRADIQFLEELYTEATIKGNADEVVIVDTLGVATPETMTYLTRKVKEWVDVPIMVHCHNEFGLGNACTIAALQAGASYAHVTVNGLGEKAGNVDIAELVLSAMLYGMDHEIDLKVLYQVAREVEQISKVPLSPLKPIVGENIFVRESGVAVSQLRTYPPAVETFSAELVGRHREVELSKKSGKDSIKYILEQRGIKAADTEIDRLVEHVKLQGIDNRGTVTINQFGRILKKVLGDRG